MTDYELNTLRAIAAGGPEGVQWDEGSKQREAAIQHLCECGYVTIYVQRAADDNGLVRTIVVTGEGLDALRPDEPAVDPASVLAMALHDRGMAVRVEDIQALACLMAGDDDARKLMMLYVMGIRARAKAA